MISTFAELLEHLNISDACRIDKRVFKKLFLDSGALDTTDKKSLKDDVTQIRWLYTLKPSTINIAEYSDSLREYSEVAVLHVELSSPNRMERIAHFINRSIPYPLVLLFTDQSVVGDSVSVSLATKRINQAHRDKWVLEELVSSGWLNLGDQSELENEFLESFKFTDLPFTDFWQLYQALLDRVVAMNCSVYNGAFIFSSKGSAGRLECLRELEKLSALKLEILKKLKKEKRMGRQVELNTRVKDINDRIAEVKDSL